MTDSPTLTYNKLIIEANYLGRRMRVLHDAVNKDMGAVLDDHYDGQLDELSVRLFGIGSVLELLRGTPNAYLNPEAMAALKAEVDEASELEGSEWARTILDEVDSIDW